MITDSNKPILIVLSCTRNYGWVTRAFLEGNLHWADYIVIVDQMSTDGTREMCAEYGDKVIIVDDPDMTYKESTRAIMAFSKGREIAGSRDHIFFALDIDEVMPSNWMDTDDGRRIMNSKPGDEFSLHWANLNSDNKTYYEDDCKNPWVVQYKVLHDEPSKEFGETALQIHSPLLPYMNYDTPPYEVKDFPLLHFGIYNRRWNTYKQKFYQIQEIRQKHCKSLVQVYRRYGDVEDGTKHDKPIKEEWLFGDWDIFSSIDTVSIPVFVDYIKEVLKQDGIQQYVNLNIWSKDLCESLGINNPSRWYHRVIHWYLTKTQKYRYLIPIKAMDRLLKVFI